MWSRPSGAFPDSKGSVYSYGLKGFCQKYSVNDPSFYNQIAFWKKIIYPFAVLVMMALDRGRRY